MPRLAVFASVAALGIAIAAGGLAVANSSSSLLLPSGMVQVTGTSTVLARPDTLTVNLTVKVIRPSATAALREDDTEMKALQRVFLHAGVPAKDLTTTSLSVGKNYNAMGNPSGYVASNGLEVTLKELAKAGALISSAQTSVGNDVSIDDITYSLVNVNGVLNSARAAAVRNARAAARMLSEAGGSTVAGISKITDESTSTTPILFNNSATSPKAAAGAPAVPLKPGTQSVTATVEVVFTLAK